MYIALISHSPCKYCKYFKCHGAWEDHHIFDDRPPCLNKVHYHYRLILISSIIYISYFVKPKFTFQNNCSGKDTSKPQTTYPCLHKVFTNFAECAV